MKVTIYTIQDLAVGSFLQPFFRENNVVATRQLTDMVNDGEHMFSKHPGDFVLWKIGVYDDQSGTICNDEAKRIYSLSTLVKVNSEVDDNE